VKKFASLWSSSCIGITMHGSENVKVTSRRWVNNQLDAEDAVFIGVSTCFSHHHTHDQEIGTKSTTPMVYSTVK
jgi:hypothetical protein